MLIDPKSPVPIFQQIASQVRQRIAAGVYRANESLPSLRSLAAEIKVNPNTVQKAYDELTREGLVESRRGSGLFVVDRSAAGGTTGDEKRMPARALRGHCAMRFEPAFCPSESGRCFAKHSTEKWPPRPGERHDHNARRACRGHKGLQGPPADGRAQPGVQEWQHGRACSVRTVPERPRA